MSKPGKRAEPYRKSVRDGFRDFFRYVFPGPYELREDERELLLEGYAAGVLHGIHSRQADTWTAADRRTSDECTTLIAELVKRREERKKK